MNSGEPLAVPADRGRAGGNRRRARFLSGVRSVLNTLAVFVLMASLGIGTIIGSLIAMCWFERRMLGEEPLPSPARHHCTEPEPAEPQVTEPQIAEPSAAEPQVIESRTAEPEVVEPRAGESRPQRIAVPTPSAGPRVPVLAADADQSGVLKSAKSNPGETTQVTSDSTVAEATARCHVPAGTST